MRRGLAAAMPIIPDNDPTPGRPPVLLRSLLFVPGIRQNMIDKAPSVPADAICLDLEDSVPPAEKAAARRQVAENLARLELGGRALLVRVNPLSSGQLEADLEAVVGPRLDAISLPKVENADDVRRVSAQIDRLE